METHTDRMYDLMKAESNRLRTFQMSPAWPKDYVDIKKLAKAGFFYAFKGDDVHCAFCRGQVRRWNREDDPMTEHAKHFTTCPFIMGGEVGNLPLGEDPFPGAKRPRPYDVCGAQPNYPPNDPRLREEQEERRRQRDMLGTHEESNESSEQNSSLHTENPSTDEMEEDEEHHSQSSLLNDLARFDYDYTNASQRSSQQNHQSTLTISTSQQLQRLYVPPTPPRAQLPCADARLTPIEESHYRNRSQDSPPSNNSSSASSENLNGICKICYSNSIELVFLPCGHSVSCLSCAQQLDKCPCCRTGITTRIRTFLV